MIVYPKEYLAKARELTREYGIHLIADEVAVGFGRTGKMFACEHANIQPDFMCLSKGITSGYLPMGATLTSEEIYQAFYADYLERKTFYHGHTYAANPLSCSAAIASLDLFQEEDTLNRIGKLIPVFREGLEGLRDLPFVGDIRSIGMIGAVELVRNKKLKTPFNFEERIGFEVYKRGLANGLLLRPLGDVIYLFLPLCVKKRELVTILDSYYETIKEIKP
jgi:adenosylmethionine-8-amino-7-oxononanoate aminotransferase